MPRYRQSSHATSQSRAKASPAPETGLTLQDFRNRTIVDLRRFVDELYSGANRVYLEALADCLEGIRVEVMKRRG